jgi:hypothetical protein
VNYDPLKWCSHGQHRAPRQSFRVLPIPGKPPRMVCDSCYQRVMAEREKRKGLT